MTRDEIVAAVLDITSRIDKQTYLLGIIDSVCRSITSRVLPAEALVEESIAVDRASLIHNITLSDAFLTTEYLRPVPYNKLLRPIVPSKAVLQGGELVNVYYRAGNTLIVRLGSHYPTDTLAFGWYSQPPKLINGVDENWITLHYTELLIMQLALRVFTLVVDTDGMTAMRNASAELFAEFTTQQSSAGVNGILGS